MLLPVELHAVILVQLSTEVTNAEPCCLEALDVLTCWLQLTQAMVPREEQHRGSADFRWRCSLSHRNADPAHAGLFCQPSQQQSCCKGQRPAPSGLCRCEVMASSCAEEVQVRY